MKQLCDDFAATIYKPTSGRQAYRCFKMHWTEVNQIFEGRKFQQDQRTENVCENK